MEDLSLSGAGQSGGSGGKKQGDRRCWNCDKPGHVKADCVEPKRKKKKKFGPSIQSSLRPGDSSGSGNSTAPTSFVSGSKVENLTINWGIPVAASVIPAPANSTPGPLTVAHPSAPASVTRLPQSSRRSPTQSSLPSNTSQPIGVSRDELLSILTQLTESTRTMVQEQTRMNTELVREGVRREFEAYDSRYNDNTGNEPMDYTDDTSNRDADDPHLHEGETQG